MMLLLAEAGLIFPEEGMTEAALYAGINPLILVSLHPSTDKQPKHEDQDDKHNGDPSPDRKSLARRVHPTVSLSAGLASVLGDSVADQASLAGIARSRRRIIQ